MIAAVATLSAAVSAYIFADDHRPTLGNAIEHGWVLKPPVYNALRIAAAVLFLLALLLAGRWIRTTPTDEILDAREIILALLAAALVGVAAYGATRAIDRAAASTSSRGSPPPSNTAPDAAPPLFACAMESDLGAVVGFTDLGYEICTGYATAWSEGTTAWRVVESNITGEPLAATDPTEYRPRACDLWDGADGHMTVLGGPGSGASGVCASFRRDGWTSP